MKTVLFVPGFRESLDSGNYTAVLKAIESRGYKVQFVPINWSRTTINNWVNQLEEVSTKHDPSNTILAGFSFGAVTAFMAATKRNPAELWLFSLSPYFAEDQISKNMKQVWMDEIGKRRIKEFSKLNFQSLAKLISCKTLLFIGSQEIINYPIMGERFDAAGTYIVGCKKITVTDAEHDIANQNYVKTIAQNI